VRWGQRATHAALVGEQEAREWDLNGVPLARGREQERLPEVRRLLVALGPVVRAQRRHVWPAVASHLQTR
jgi:hypothetical protein